MKTPHNECGTQSMDTKNSAEPAKSLVKLQRDDATFLIEFVPIVRRSLFLLSFRLSLLFYVLPRRSHSLFPFWKCMLIFIYLPAFLWDFFSSFVLSYCKHECFFKSGENTVAINIRLLFQKDFHHIYCHEDLIHYFRSYNMVLWETPGRFVLRNFTELHT